MAFISRDPFTARIIKAFGLKSYPSDLSSTIVPVTQLMDVERGAWPPMIPWDGIVVSGAVALNRSLVACVLATAGVPPYARCVVDRLEIVSGETSGQIRMTRGATSGVASLTLYVNPIRRDIQDDISIDATSSSSGLVAEIGLYQRNSAVGPALHAGNNLLYPTANSLLVVEPLFPIAILAPGESLFLENNTVNLALNVRMSGRYFVGQ